MTEVLLNASPHRLIGRADELGRVLHLFMRAEARLVTITGVGGIGKTRLALEAARKLDGYFRDGARFVELASCREPELVLSTIQQAIVPADPDSRRYSMEALRRVCQSLELLLVLDNFEQVLEAAPFIAELLAACHRLHVLVTSRAPLRLSWEEEVPLGPLATPEASAQCDEVLASPSVALLVERLRSAGVTRIDAPEQVGMLAAICRRVDGIPLAIELASARARLLGVPGLLERLERPLDLLADGSRDAPDRHRRLRATFDWSYELLPASDRRVFRHLGVFVGGCSYEAAAHVCGASPDDIEFLNALERVLDSGLIRRIEAQGPLEPCLHMLEPVREYALELLRQSGEDELALRRHAEVYVDLAERADRDRYSLPEPNWIRLLTKEHANARAALRWLIANNEVEYTLRLTVGLAKFWWVQGFLRMHQESLDEALQLADAAVPNAALRIARRAAYIEQSVGRFHTGDFVGAEAAARVALASFQENEDPASRAYALVNLGNCALARENLEAARMHFQEALELYEAAGMSGGVARSQMHLGRVAWIAREYDRARDLLTACAPGLRQTRDRWSAAFALRTLALVECYAGQFEVARSHLRDSLAIWREVGGRVLLAQLIETSAILAAAAGSYSKAFRMAGAAAAQRLEIETPPTPTWQREIDRWLQRAHAEISVEASDRSFAEGKAMSIDDAVAEAEFREIQAGPALTPLTARELEILCLVASGSTNKEIAAHLHISVATVERHLGNLYGKIGARHRSDATAYAITRHLARQ